MKNRTIKFRAWDKEKKEMTPTFQFNEMCFKGIWDLFPLLKNFDPEYVMQFTGLLDKNGKEIYEGDIVKGDDYQRFPGNSVVVFGDTGWFLEIDTGKSKYRESFFGIYQEGRHIEVIGNIYENPELLSPNVK